MKVISRVFLGMLVCLVAVILSPIIIALGALILALFAVLLEFIWALFAFWIIGCIAYGIIVTH